MVDFCHILSKTGWSQWHNDTQICICYVCAGRSRQHDEYWQDLRVTVRSRHDDTKHCKSSLRRIFPTVTKHWKSSFRLISTTSLSQTSCHCVGDFAPLTRNIANLGVIMLATSAYQHETLQIFGLSCQRPRPANTKIRNGRNQWQSIVYSFSNQILTRSISYTYYIHGYGI